MKKQHSGGARTHHEVPQKLGKPAQGRNEGRVAQRGVAVDPKAVEERFKPMPHGGDVPLGNEVATNTVCGPGGSRTVMRSGSQSTHGAVNPGNAPAKNKDILSGFGPEKST